ncbi:ImmA/IrrE family metallo-endopeptidase [Salinibacter ruber]|uniref:ImmA/IrrE family metallo-endopeptidase n=1 Tax=Salinibacter ruber TaxID=146919 RepID=UPI0020734CE1|nr:ImmA/IrrE family metallo-endopeptidase [Salinibacter ruber]
MPDYLSRDDVEERAASMLRRYGRETGREVTPPVKVSLIGGMLCDLRWEYDLIEDESTLAALYPESQVVKLNELFADRFEEVSGFDRFTKGHEVGHWVLHVEDLGDSSPPLDAGTDGERVFCRDGSDDWTERQADWFAAGLLMPEPHVNEAVSGYDSMSWSTIERLSEQFDVSKEAMKVRLERLGLAYVDEETGRVYRSRGEAQGQQTLF